MDLKSIDERLVRITRLSREEQLQLREDIFRFRPELLKPWRWFYPCTVNVLLVTDRTIDFSANGFSLSTFVSVFKKLEQESTIHIKYKVTLAHRDNVNINSPAMQGGNPDIHHRISQFKFDNNAHFTPTKYDQIWLFGFHTASRSLDPTEVNQIEAYMNGGGGVFATGDHGAFGLGMCGQIPRVKDMRVWDHTSGNPDQDEVSMGFKRRNDTNQPKPGNSYSLLFNDERDNIPQKINTKLYGIPPQPLLPHPLLSIKPTLKANGIIDIMPDHPHEGQCQPEKIFTVRNPRTGLNHQISSEHISFATVISGNLGGHKRPTDPHCFPSICVFDGRPANIGRIVVDSTWHHFLNLNIQGLDPQDYTAVEQYYKNIAFWITRRKLMLCVYKRFVVDAIFSARVMEASVDDPDTRLEDIPVQDLFTIGKHVIDVVSENLTPAEGKLFELALLEPLMSDLAKQLNPWVKPEKPEEVTIANQWINPDPLCAIGIGTAVIKLRDEFGEINEAISEELEARIDKTFERGLADGLKLAIDGLELKLKEYTGLKDKILEDTYLVEGTITDASGKAAAGLRVKAVDQDFTDENLLGEIAITDDKGHYRIPYKQTDFVINGKESGGADIILYISNQEGELLKKTKVYRDSDEKITIDVKLDK